MIAGVKFLLRNTRLGLTMAERPTLETAEAALGALVRADPSLASRLVIVPVPRTLYPWYGPLAQPTPTLPTVRN